MHAAISQRHGFPQNGVTYERTQRASNYHLHAAAQELLEVNDQAARKPWCGITGHVNKQVHIAVRSIFSASHRSEKQYVSRAVGGGHPKNGVAMFSYLLTGSHSSIILALPRIQDPPYAQCHHPVHQMYNLSWMTPPA